jgi:hypothetical protein
MLSYDLLDAPDLSASKVAAVGQTERVQPNLLCSSRALRVREPARHDCSRRGIRDRDLASEHSAFTTILAFMLPLVRRDSALIEVMAALGMEKAADDEPRR